MERRKKKPLSDITNNYNLIPTSTLRELVAASSNPSSFSKPPTSILKSISSSANQNLCSESSNISDASIESSNVGAARNSRTVQFQTPPRAISSTAIPGCLGSKDAAYNQRQTTEKYKKESEANVLIASPTPVEKRKDKGKAIAVSFSSSPVKMKDNQKGICNPYNPLDGKLRQDEANHGPVSGGLVERLKEPGKQILNTYSRSYEKTKKGKACLNLSGSMGQQEMAEKGVTNHSSSSSERRNDGKKGNVGPSGSSVKNKRERGKEFVDPSSLLIERTTKEILQTVEMGKITKHKEPSVTVAVNCQSPRRKSEKGKNDTGASSCPPMRRTKNIQNDFDEGSDTKSSNSWTDPLPKCRKKRCSRIKSNSEVPLDFIEQQKAYFKEVDEFELPEEEISQDELD